MTFADLRVDDQVLITGTSSSPDGTRWERADAVVATLSADGYVKVWVGVDGEKVWFPAAGIEALELVQRDE